MIIQSRELRLKNLCERARMVTVHRAAGLSGMAGAGRKEKDKERKGSLAAHPEFPYRMYLNHS